MELIGGWIWSALSSLFSGATNIYQAKQNRDFQQDMSNTAHQREIMDLRAAGLNPILSVSRGGASTPGGSQARVDSLNESVNTAISYKLMKSQLEKLNAETRKIKADAINAEKENPYSRMFADFMENVIEPFYRSSSKDGGALNNFLKEASSNAWELYINTRKSYHRKKNRLRDDLTYFTKPTLRGGKKRRPEKETSLFDTYN